MSLTNLDDFEVAEEVVDKKAEAEREWLAARSGMLTCSKFPELMKEPGNSNAMFTDSAYTYLREVVAERIGSFKHSFSASSVNWGHENEPAAVKAYEEFTGNQVDYDSHRFERLTKWVGGSPDGLVGADRTLEIKCPYNPGKHIEVLHRGTIPKIYYWQCVGHCYVTRRKACDFVSFDPRIEGPHRIKVIELVPTEHELLRLAERLREAIRWIRAILDKIESEES